MRPLNPVVIIQPTPRWLKYSHLLPSVMCSLTFRSLAGISCRTLVLEWSVSQQRGPRILRALFQPDNRQVCKGYPRLLRPQTNPTEHSSVYPSAIEVSTAAWQRECQSLPEIRSQVRRLEIDLHNIWALSRAWSLNVVLISRWRPSGSLITGSS